MRTLSKRNLLFVLLLITPSLVAADRLTVILDWFVNPDHGPVSYTHLTLPTSDLV